MESVSYSVDIPGGDQKLGSCLAVAIKPSLDDWRLLMMKVMFLRLEELGGSSVVNFSILEVYKVKRDLHLRVPLR